MRACCVLLTFFVAASLANANERPNLVFIIADDCTWLDLEVYGGQAHTPCLNRLAGEGMRFTRCFQAAPMCSPTRHNIYTGLYPVRSGAYPNHTCVYPGTKSIALYLKAGGYRVALSGKTHIAPPESFPFEYDSEFSARNPYQEDPYPTLRKLIRESVAADHPFCIFACSKEPHSPYTKGDPSAYPPDSLILPPSWVDTAPTRTEYSRYLAEITYFDAQCAALLKLLDSQNVRENTLVMVVSEQGSSFPFAKWTCYEPGLASAMIVRWPGRVTPGSVSHALVEYCDVTPTFLDAAKLPIPDGLDGKSFLPVLLQKSDHHKTYTFGIHTTRGIINGSDAFGIRSCATTRYRYIRNLHSENTFTNAVTAKTDPRTSVWGSWLAVAESGDARASQLVRKYQHRPPEELYDVIADPHCLNNLIHDAQLSQIRRDLSEQLDRWMKDQGDRGRETEELAHTRKAAYQKQQTKKKKNTRKRENNGAGRTNSPAPTEPQH